MPPIRTESSQKPANQEGKILLALNDIKNGRIASIRAAAKLYDIPPERYRGGRMEQSHASIHAQIRIN